MESSNAVGALLLLVAAYLLFPSKFQQSRWLTHFAWGIVISSLVLQLFTLADAQAYDRRFPIVIAAGIGSALASKILPPQSSHGES